MSLRLTSGLHVQNPLSKNQQNLYTPYIYSKFTYFLLTIIKTGKLVIERRNVAIATKSPDQIRDHFGFKTGRVVKNGQLLGTSTLRISPLVKTGQKLATKTGHPTRHSSHTNTRIVARPPHHVVQRVVQQSPQRVIKTPLIEDLLDPNRPRNGLIDGRLALQVVVVQD